MVPLKALSLNHSRRSAVEGPLSKERRSSYVYKYITVCRCAAIIMYKFGTDTQHNILHRNDKVRDAYKKKGGRSTNITL